MFFEIFNAKEYLLRVSGHNLPPDTESMIIHAQPPIRRNDIGVGLFLFEAKLLANHRVELKESPIAHRANLCLHTLEPNL